MERSFKTDAQTLKDLQIQGVGGKSIFGFFDRTVSDGGQEALRELFYTPLADIDGIRERQEAIAMADTEADFAYDRLVLKDLERYLGTYRSLKEKPDFTKKMRNLFVRHSPAYYYKERSVRETLETLIALRGYLKALLKRRPSHQGLIAREADVASCIGQLLKPRRHGRKDIRITVFNIDRYDYVIRITLKEKIKELLQFLYELDAYRSVAIVQNEAALVFPEFHAKGETNGVEVKGLYHLFNDRPVPNDVVLSRRENLWFLTGANMAGKSTLIKALSVAVYLAHIGFPVPAESMRLDLMDGLFTTINLDDDIDLGYSHFYHEAARLKAIVDQLGPDSNALIVLDELFKGTNYQDSYDAIFRVIRAFSGMPNGPYVVISSHLTELASELEGLENIALKCMDTRSDVDGLPVFTYKIQQGVAQEKLGMWLLEKSGLFNALGKHL